MNNIVEAEYTVVPEHTLPEIIAEIKIIEQNVAKTAMEGAIQIGQRLQEAKEQVGHGGFDAWCQENLNYTRRTAENFMRIAREFGGENSLISNAKMSSHLSISNALSLLKVPEEDREKFVEEHPVEDMTNKALEDEIKRLKEEKKQAEQTAQDAMNTANEADTRAYDLETRVKKLEQELAIAQAEPAFDPSKTEAEIEELKVQLEKAQSDLRAEKDKLKKEKDSREDAIKKKVREEIEEAEGAARKEAQAELDQARANIASLQAENDRLMKRDVNAENKVEFKVWMDQLQKAFHKAQDCIANEADDVTQERMQCAVGKVLEKLMKEATDAVDR